MTAQTDTNRSTETETEEDTRRILQGDEGPVHDAADSDEPRAIQASSSKQ